MSKGNIHKVMLWRNLVYTRVGDIALVTLFDRNVFTKIGKKVSVFGVLLNG